MEKSSVFVSIPELFILCEIERTGILFVLGRLYIMYRLLSSNRLKEFAVSSVPPDSVRCKYLKGRQMISGYKKFKIADNQSIKYYLNARRPLCCYERTARS